MRARSAFLLCTCLAGIFFCGSGPALSQAVSLEQQVKTSYLYNFMQFVDWPEDVFAGDSKFNLCVVAGEDYNTTLVALIAERVDGHEIAVHRFDDFAQINDVRCHLLFISRSKYSSAPKNFSGERGLLTIGDIIPGFLERGGIINLVEVNGKVRFEINQQAAHRAGLTMSSKLLDLSMRQL